MGRSGKILHAKHEAFPRFESRGEAALARGGEGVYFWFQPQMEGDMTPERPRRADATDATVETPQAVFRADEPSALHDPGSSPRDAAQGQGTKSWREQIDQPRGRQV